MDEAIRLVVKKPLQLGRWCAAHCGENELDLGRWAAQELLSQGQAQASAGSCDQIA